MYRPSGSLNWALACAPPLKWHFLGSVNSEDRSTQTFQMLSKFGSLTQSRVISIRWPFSPYQADGQHLTEANLELVARIAPDLELRRRDLLAPVCDFLVDAKDLRSQSVVLDITSMPKRFYFYYLKSLLADKNIKNLLITYCGGVYGKGPLSENHEDWDVLPSFRGRLRSVEESARTRLVVNVGFMPGGLQEHLKSDDSELDIFLIIPFPARVSSVRRVWKSAMEIHSDWHGASSAIHFRRNAPDDVSGAFDLLCSIAAGQPLSLAPFGPKPISAAMCIFASLTDAPVYYAQPKWYNPLYTTSTELDASGIAKISAHWVKYDGNLLFEIPHS